MRIDCSNPCKTCSGSDTTCTSCDTASANPLFYNDDCVANCPDGYYALSGICTGEKIFNNPLLIFLY